MLAVPVPFQPARDLRRRIFVMRLRLLVMLLLFLALPVAADGWMQLGRDAGHGGTVPVVAQPLAHVYADIVYDPFVPVELSLTGGVLLAHYQAALIDGDDVFMEFKGGVYSGLDSWESQRWSVRRHQWDDRGKLLPLWSATSDWTPVPAGPNTHGWEPLFHAALANGFLYEPGAGGTLLQISREDGSRVQRINPFGPTVNSAIFTVSPLTADPAGNIYYTAMQLDPAGPWDRDIRGAWLVRVTPEGTPTAVPFASLVTGAPKANGLCTFRFDFDGSVLPPSPNAVAPSITCGSQRPAINAAPAVAPDGTIYFVSRTHFNSFWGTLVAVNADLTPRWSASLRNRLHDGCNVLLPPNGSKGGCRNGTATGVDPYDNLPGSGVVVDTSTSSPVVAPDGAILFGVFNTYNDFQGHLMKFSADGSYQAAYLFGWDITPAIWPHDGTYSIVTKENHYGGPIHPTPGYYITQLDPDLKVEWQVKNTNVNACGRDANGTIFCVPEQPNGFEWCVNAPAVDAEGNVYVNSEDGNLYQIGQPGVVRQTLFLQLALGAAYTPVSIGPDGRVYAQNAGHLFAIGGLPRRRAAKP
jgi:hypothetical protein